MKSGSGAAEIAAERARGYQQGWSDGTKSAVDSLAGVAKALGEIERQAQDARVLLSRTSDQASRLQTQPAPAPAPQRTPSARPVTPANAAPNGDRPLGAERRPLAVLAGVYPAGMTEAQWAVAAGLKRTGGTWAAYVSRLRSAGRIVQNQGQFFATETGIADLGGNIQPLPAPASRWLTIGRSALAASARCCARWPRPIHPGGAAPNWLPTSSSPRAAAPSMHICLACDRPV